MKRYTLTLAIVSAFAAFVFAGPEPIASSSKEMKAVVQPMPPPCPSWTGFYVGGNLGYALAPIVSFGLGAAFGWSIPMAFAAVQGAALGGGVSEQPFLVDGEAGDVVVAEGGGSPHVDSRIVHRGDALGMFPEGTRQEREPGPVLPGAAMIAVQEGAPVVCGAIHGTQKYKVGNLAPRRPFAVCRMPSSAVPMS